MEGGYPHLLRAKFHKRLHALAHFTCGLVGKGKREHIPRLYPVLHKVCDAVGKNAGFPAARACKNKKRALQALYRLALPFIQDA